MASAYPDVRRRARWAAITLALCVSGIVLIGARDADGNDTSVDLEALYPGDTSTYLEGNNWALDPPQRSVLWFRDRIRGYWSQYNWGPEDRQADCHEDRFRWYRGELRYVWTDNRCDGQDTRTRYKPAVVYMPAEWTPGVEWSRCGRSTVRHRDGGVIVRTGTTVWCSQVVGVVELQPGRPAVQVDVRLDTIWDNEPISNTTRWVETLYLDPDVGLARHVGGNLDGGFWWDWWLTHRAVLPAGVSS